MPEPAVAVTPYGPIKFDSVELALSSAFVGLPDPIYVEAGPIDVTYLRGPRLESYTPDQAPWPALMSAAVSLKEPDPALKRADRARYIAEQLGVR